MMSVLLSELIIKNDTLARNTEIHFYKKLTMRKCILKVNKKVTDIFSRLCEISDKTEYLTLLEELDGPLSIEYLNLMYEPSRSTEEIALLVVPKELNQDIYRKLAKTHNS